MKLIRWTNKIIANTKAVFAGPHGGVSKNISKATFRNSIIFQSEVLRSVFHRLLFACVSTSTITKDELMLKKLGQLSQ